MPLGRRLTAGEQSFLLGARKSDEGRQRSLRHIQQLLEAGTGQKRSLKVIRAFLNDPSAYGSKAKNAGRKPKFSDRVRRAVVKEALDNPARGARGVASIISSEVRSISKSTVHTILRSNKFVALVRVKPKPSLTPGHKEARLAWAEIMLKDATPFKQVIWTDEKRFNLDGPDYYNFYWHDLRRQAPQRVSRRFGGGGIMFWAAFSGSGIRVIAKVDGTLDACKYQQLLSDSLLPKLPKRAQARNQLIFQQDNASPHAAKSTQTYLQQHFQQIMKWPARSPDLNPVENVWGWMVHQLYSGNRQYSSLQELEDAVLQCWRNLDEGMLLNLVMSMPDRAVAVLRAGGDGIGF